MKTLRLPLIACALFIAPIVSTGSAKAKPTPKPKARPAQKARPRVQAARDSVAARRQRAIEYVKRAAIAYDRRDYQTVIVLCKNANSLAPTYARAYAWMGAAYQKIGNYSEARFAYRWVVALAPGTPDATRAARGLREIGGR